MRILHGIAASQGTAIASIYRLTPPDLSVQMVQGLNSVDQKKHFSNAVEQAKRELRALYEAVSQTDKSTAAVFEVHQMMLDDPDFFDAVEDKLSTGVNAEWAVRETADSLKIMFDAIDDEYLRARGADIIDISNRVIRILKGIPEQIDNFSEKVIVVAEDLLPSQTVKLDKKNVSGFVTKRGSFTSHSVILARAMGIPCVVGMNEQFDQIPFCGILAIDGTSGEVIYNPDDAVIAAYRQRIKAHLSELHALECYRGRQTVTPAGHHVLAAANIGSPEDAEDVLKYDGDGVGLFRSEFLYLESPDFPGEDTQFEAYKAVLSRLDHRPVVIRTLDLGSDKQAPYFDLSGEENPALGYRAIRICLKRPDIFKTQLKALLRASIYGKLCIMFPMISHLEQVRAAKEVLREVKAELDAENIPYASDVEVGIMVETPAAALISDLLAPEVDFFSIGTNDLTQYTLAVDRMNANIVELFDSAHPSVLRLIELTAKNAHANGIWVGICGESAANTALTDFYMSVGIDELSVSPTSILSVKRAVIESKAEKV